MVRARHASPNLLTDKEPARVQEGDIIYYDGSALERPQSIPKNRIFFVVIAVILAIFIGAFILNHTVYESVRQNVLAQQTLEQNLQREPSIDTLPVLPSIAFYGDDDLRNLLINDIGYTVYDVSLASEDSGLLLYKVPSDVSLEDATLLYSQGVSNLTASQAALILNGGWQLSTDSAGMPTKVVRYADFDAASVEEAIQKCIAREGFDPATESDTGVDDAGNTYHTGTIYISDVPFVWTVSALPLSDVYNIAGLPENAVYVGCRITETV